MDIVGEPCETCGEPLRRRSQLIWAGTDPEPSETESWICTNLRCYAVTSVTGHAEHVGIVANAVAVSGLDSFTT